MEAATAPSESAAPKEKEKAERTSTVYVALVKLDESESSDFGDPTAYRVVCNADGEPREFKAYRQEQVIEDLINERYVQADDEGKTPFIAIVPARSWKPRKATIATQTRVSLDG